MGTVARMTRARTETSTPAGAEHKALGLDEHKTLLADSDEADSDEDGDHDAPAATADEDDAPDPTAEQDTVPTVQVEFLHHHAAYLPGDTTTLPVTVARNLAGEYRCRILG